MTTQPHQYQFIEPSDQRWLDFITSRNGTNIFHHPAWINTLADCYGYRPFIVAVCDETGTITAAVPMMEVNSFITGRRWISLPYSDHCCPLYREDEFLDQLLNSLEFIYSNGIAPKIELRWDYSKNPAFAVHSDYFWHTLELHNNIDDISANVKKSFRQCIGQAKKLGVRIEWGDEEEHFQEFYGHMLVTRRRHGVPLQPKRFFELLKANVIDKGLGYLLCAYKDDRCLASLLVLHWQKTMTIKYSGSTALKSDLQLRPNHLLYWTAISWGVENGFLNLDMGRCSTANSGLRAYKRRWGVQEYALKYSSLSTEKRRVNNHNLMTFMQFVIRKSPAFVCEVSGELLYKHFA